jgi:hypothetical protein
MDEKEISDPHSAASGQQEKINEDSFPLKAES